MLRLLLWIALLWLLWRALRPARPRVPPRAGTPRDDATGTMARCSRCGTFVPRETLGRNDLCKQCRDAQSA